MSSLKPYIYLFRRRSDNKPVYVGQHNGTNPNYITSSTVLNRSLRKWGSIRFWETYSREILCYCTIDELNELESKFISKFNTYEDKDSGFNLTPGGDHIKHSRSTREKLSRSHTGKTLSQEHKDKIRKNSCRFWEGKKLPQETLDKMSKKLAGKVPWNKGKTRDRVECNYCKKLVDAANGKRWHFDNCKKKPNK